MTKPYYSEVGVGDARHSEAFRDEDRRRSLDLARRCRELYHCKHCGKGVHEDTRTPGVCKRCKGRR